MEIQRCYRSHSSQTLKTIVSNKFYKSSYIILMLSYRLHTRNLCDLFQHPVLFLNICDLYEFMYVSQTYHIQFEAVFLYKIILYDI